MAIVENVNDTYPRKRDFLSTFFLRMDFIVHVLVFYLAVNLNFPSKIPINFFNEIGSWVHLDRQQRDGTASNVLFQGDAKLSDQMVDKLLGGKGRVFHEKLLKQLLEGALFSFGHQAYKECFVRLPMADGRVERDLLVNPQRHGFFIGKKRGKRMIFYEPEVVFST